MATKAPLSSLYAETPEEQNLVDEIKGSYDNLRSSLEARQKQLFDPVLLAMAQGFLAPTKSGTFGETLSNVAALVGPAQESQDKRAREIAEMRMALAQQELAQRQATRGEAEFRRLLGRMGDSELKAPEGPPVEGDQYMPSRDPNALVAQATQGARDITPQDIARLATIAPDKAKILSDMIKMDQERYSIAMNGIVFDKKTRQYLNLEIPGQKQEPFTTKFGTFNMTPYEYSDYKRADSQGRGKEWIDSFRGAAAPTGAAPAGAPAGAAPAGRQTVAEQAAEAEAARVRATETAKAEAGRTQSAIETGSNITDQLAAINALRGIVNKPDASQFFGIFNRPDVSSAILNLVQEGVRSQGNSIQVGALEDSLRNIGLKQEQIDRYRFGLAQMANIQLLQAKLAAGQGAISNFERDLFANATISPKDNPATILAKLNMIEARAQFNRQVASELRKSKMSVDDFRDSNQYQNLVNNYLQRVSTIASSIGSQRPASGAPANAGNYNPASERLRRELGIGGQ